MRESKFRCYDRLNNKMTYGINEEVKKYPYEGVQLHPVCLVNAILSSDKYLEKFLSLDLIFMQYTGLKDKNGVEIYEGDIYIMGDKRILSIVVWHDSGFKGKQKGTYGSYAGLEYHQRWIEVIGNIYENSELLK